jgi:hypothetical protein
VEADTPLLIDADRVLPLAVVPERFQPIAWRHTQVFEIRRTVEHLQFGKRLFRDGRETPVSTLHP